MNAIEQISAIASVRPLTVRKGGMVFTDMMRDLHQGALSEQRLEFLGSAAMSRAAVESLFDGLTAAHSRAVRSGARLSMATSTCSPVPDPA